MLKSLIFTYKSLLPPFFFFFFFFFFFKHAPKKKVLTWWKGVLNLTKVAANRIPVSYVHALEYINKQSYGLLKDSKSLCKNLQTLQF